MPTNKLTDAECKKLSADKPTKVYDGGGLHLWVTPHSKVWRLDYRQDGRAQTLVIGPYPDVTLKTARARRDEAKERIRQGLPVKDQAQPKKADATVQEVCSEFWESRADITEDYRSNAVNALKRYVYPKLGGLPVAGMRRADVMAALTVIEAAGKLDYVRKVRLWLSMALDWAVERELIQHNVCLDINPAKAFAKKAVEHEPALEPAQMETFWRHLSAEGITQSALACMMLALTWVRTGELRQMEWSEVDGSTWRIPAAKMKRRKDHVVPLPAQALQILRVLESRNPGSRYVFYGARSLERPMSENAVLYLLYRAGYRGKMTGHGFRSVASTWAHDNGYDPKVIEAQLAHSPEDKVASAYNRSAYIEQRRAMLQAYADWCVSSGMGGSTLAFTKVERSQ